MALLVSVRFFAPSEQQRQANIKFEPSKVYPNEQRQHIFSSAVRFVPITQSLWNFSAQIDSLCGLLLLLLLWRWKKQGYEFPEMWLQHDQIIMSNKILVLNMEQWCAVRYQKWMVWWVPAPLVLDSPGISDRGFLPFTWGQFVLQIAF